MGVGVRADVESDEGFKVVGIVTLQDPDGITVVLTHSGGLPSSDSVLFIGTGTYTQMVG